MKAARNNIPRSISMLLTIVLLTGMFILLPEKTYAADAGDIAVGDFIDIGNADVPGYTGIPHWRVLDKKNGSLLLISEYLWRGNGTDENAGVSFMPSGEFYKPDGQRDFRGTNAEAWCNDFYENVLEDVQGLEVIPQTESDPEYLYEQTLYPGNNKKLRFRSADTVMYQNTVFFLSAEEAVRYMPAPADRKTSLAGGSDSYKDCEWSLRSTEVSTGNNFATYVKDDGELAYVNADQTKPARPAFVAQFAKGTSFVVSSTDESGAKTWTTGEEQAEPEDPKDPKDPEDPQDPYSGTDKKPSAETKVKRVKTVTVNVATVTAKAVDKAVKKAGGSNKYVTKIILGKKVRKISPKAFAKYKKLTTLEVRTKKLTKKRVKKALKGSKVKTIKVKVAKKTKTNRKYVKKYKKIFTKKNAGKKVKVKL